MQQTARIRVSSKLSAVREAMVGQLDVISMSVIDVW
jgi:hypothetical protein